MCAAAAAAVAVATDDDDSSAVTFVVHRSGMLIRGVLRKSSRVDSCWIPIRRKAILRRQEEVAVLPVVGMEEDALFIMPIAQKYLCRNRSIVEAERDEELRDNVDAVDEDEDRVEEEVVDPVDEDRVNFNGARFGLLPPLTLLLRLCPFVENCLLKW